MQQPMEFVWLKGLGTFEDIKKKYYELVKKYHPDKSTNFVEKQSHTTITQAINNEWDYIKKNNLTHTLVPSYSRPEPAQQNYAKGGNPFANGRRAGGNNFYSNPFASFFEEDDYKDSYQNTKSYSDSIFEHFERQRREQWDRMTGKQKERSEESFDTFKSSYKNPFFTKDDEFKSEPKNSEEFREKSNSKQKVNEEFEKKKEELLFNIEKEYLKEAYNAIKETVKKVEKPIGRYVFVTLTSMMMENNIIPTIKHYRFITKELLGLHITADNTAERWFETYKNLM